ncbi:MAG: DUF4981 domain-containing protein [Bacillaceae bacterium]|nr:DUF4981 domain-containing protein [Bacillaceae bacterium]
MGKRCIENKLNIDIAPQNEAEIEFDWENQLFNRKGEYCIQVVSRLKEATSWANAGHEVGFGQYVFSVDANCDDPLNPRSKSAIEHFRVVNGDVNIGVHGLDFSILFSKQVGSLISINYGGVEKNCGTTYAFVLESDNG